MKVVQIHSYGHSDQLHTEDAPKPKIKLTQVLVKVHDAGVNPIDWKIREGQMKERVPASFPLVMGQDFSGEVVEVGSEVSAFANGDRVFGFAHGSYAEYAAIDQNEIAHVPKSLDFVTAASLPTAGTTAYQILMSVVKPTSGQTVLIHGAAGGVGSFLVQIAKHLGAKVIANASREDESYLRNIGADEVIDYKTQKFEDIVKDADAVIDLVGGDTCDRSYQVLKKEGFLVSTVGAVKESEGKKVGVRTHSFMMKHDADDLKALAKLVKDGVVKPRLARVMPLEDANQAQDMNQMGQSDGKIVLEVIH